MLRFTPVVKNLIIINTVIFLLQVLLPGLHLTEHLSLWNVRSDYFKPYQLFTYMFVHSPEGFSHIFFNMLTLVFIGPLLESYWGPRRFLMFYVICGIGAGVFNVLIDLFFGVGSFSIMLGASGAIYGVLMGFGMQFPNMEIMLLIPPIPIKAKYLVFLLGGMTFLLDRSGNVAHFAHLGGVIVAFILIQIWRKGGSFY
ncbi:MAG TPA: rhomboid family intramembrane serine protease [Chryseosolibacter sp.]|jgi:membrane associated rhomboid family serine protease|nr:rhomboid family intramembrane serine protease [Chryseosolibacter sp.]